MDKNKMMRFLQGPILYILLICFLLFAVQMFGAGPRDKIQEPNYTEVLRMVENDELEHVMTSGIVLYASTKDSGIPESEFGARYNVRSMLPSVEQFYADVDKIYAAKLNVPVEQVTAKDYGFTLTSAQPQGTPWWIEWMPIMVTIGLTGLLLFFVMRQQNGGGGGKNNPMNFGKSRARITDPEKNKVTFGNVAGAEEETEELREIVEFLKDPKRFLDVGARIPKGVLLVGPPGTGKTLLARAVAGEAGVPFFTISGSDFVEMFVGVGASRVRDLFDQAKKHSPAIVFIDEIDAVGRHRGAGLGGGHDEREQTLNQLLVEMDGFTANQGIIVMAATNRADILDPALLRPGRFDRQIVVNYPDVKGREEILKIHSKSKPLAEDVDLSVIALRTPYFTGADLENVMNEAAILTARAHEKQIRMATIEEAITRVQAGPEKKSHKVTVRDKKLVAYHEAGHAVVMHYTPDSDKVHEISIIPRGKGAGGYTMYLPDEETHYMPSRKLRARMCGMMGGHCAEKLVFGDVSTGSTSDLKHATELARSMVTEYGMSEKLGPIFLGGDQEVFLGRNFSQSRSNISEEVSRTIDQEIHELLESSYRKATEILTENRDKLDRLAELLQKREKINEAEFLAVINGEELPSEEMKADATAQDAPAENT